MRNHRCPRQQNHDDCEIVVDHDGAQRADIGELWWMQRDGEQKAPLDNKIVQFVDNLLYTQFGYYDNSDIHKRFIYSC